MQDFYSIVLAWELMTLFGNYNTTLVQGLKTTNNKAFFLELIFVFIHAFY